MNPIPTPKMTGEAASLAGDFVDHSHPEFGQGYFCTPDVFARIEALAASEAEAVKVGASDKPWISDDGWERLQGVITQLEPLSRGEATRSERPGYLFSPTHTGKATIRDAIRTLSCALPMLKKVRDELR